MTDRGNGPETILVFPITWTQDEEANAIKTPALSGTSYPAVVSRQEATMTESNGTSESITSYRIMMITPIKPTITTGTDLTWMIPIGPQGQGGPPETHDLVAAGEPTQAGPSAWVVNATEITPNSDGVSGPYAPQGGIS